MAGAQPCRQVRCMGEPIDTIREMEACRSASIEPAISLTILRVQPILAVVQFRPLLMRICAVHSLSLLTPYRRVQAGAGGYIRVTKGGSEANVNQLINNDL